MPLGSCRRPRCRELRGPEIRARPPPPKPKCVPGPAWPWPCLCAPPHLAPRRLQAGSAGASGLEVNAKGQAGRRCLCLPPQVIVRAHMREAFPPLHWVTPTPQQQHTEELELPVSPALLSRLLLCLPRVFPEGPSPALHFWAGSVWARSGPGADPTWVACTGLTSWPWALWWKVPSGG